MEKIIFLITTKARLNNKPFIAAAEEPHHIAGTISVVNALDYHLTPRYVLCILDNFREYEYSLALKLFQCLVSNLARKSTNIGKGIFFLL